MQELRFSVKPLSECRKEYIEFRNANRDTVRDEAYFDWRYSGRSNAIQPLVVWAQTPSGHKVGSLSLSQDVYFIDNACYALGQLGDISVAGDWRGKGVAPRMFDFLAGLESFRSFVACFVIPNELASRPLEKAGWVTVSRIDRYAKMLNLGTAGSRLGGKAILSAVTPPINMLLKLSPYEVLLKKKPEYEGAIAHDFDERFDRLWEGYQKTGMIIGVRDSAYLKWRFTRHPVHKYRIFTLSREGALCGYIVFNFSEKGDICYIDDIMCLEVNRSSAYLLLYFIDFIRENWSSSSIFLRVNGAGPVSLPLKQFGFIKRADFQRVMVFMNPGSEPFFKGLRWYLTAQDKNV